MPQLSAICFSGPGRALQHDLDADLLVALGLSCEPFRPPPCNAASATPPPGRMPSSTAARVACSASSTRAFFCFMSVSVPAPTEMIATPPVSFASRSWNFSLSYSLSVASIWLRICWMRAWISLCLPAPCTIVVSFLSTVICLARPRWLSVRFSSLRPRSSLISVPPVSMAMSPSMALRRSPKPGALTAQMLSTPRSLLTTSAVSASPSTSSAMINSGLPDWADLLQERDQLAKIADLLLVDQDQASSSWHSISAGWLMKYGEM